jgi:hypothetical protein
VEVEEVEPIDTEAVEALVDLGPDPLRPAIDHLPPRRVFCLIRLPVDATLAGDHGVVAAAARQRLPDCPLALAVLAVAVRRVEVRDSRIDRGPHHGDRRLPGDSVAGHAGEGPAAEAKWADGNG